MILSRCYYKSSIKSEKIKYPVNLIKHFYQHFDYGQELVVVPVDVDFILNYIFVAVVLLIVGVVVFATIIQIFCNGHLHLQFQLLSHKWEEGMLKEKKKGFTSRPNKIWRQKLPKSIIFFYPTPLFLLMDHTNDQLLTIHQQIS